MENEKLILILDKEIEISPKSQIIYAMIAILPTYYEYDNYRELKDLQYEGNQNMGKN